MATGAGEGKEPAYPIGSVDKALRLLLLFREHPTVRLSEAAAAIGVAGSTAHRLLAMLQFHGFVSQDERSRFYVPGPSLLEVGLNVVRSMDIRTVARPHLERLCAELEETIHLAVLEGANVRFLDGLEPDKPLRVASRTGLRLPAHATAVGKVLLAQMDVDRITELLPVPLPRVTQNTTTSLPKLLRQLKEVRERGWAVNKGEAEEDISSIAVAIQGAHGAPHGAISVATPAFRVDADIDRHVKAAQKAADRIAAEVEGLVVPESR